MKVDYMVPKPPRTAIAFLEWYCSMEFLEEVQGDLKELFARYYDALTQAVQRINRFEPSQGGKAR